ncbi:MAG: hypothetical protein RIR69_1068 [Actinomycetota bacterium]|jgi:hypothetical protein
MEKRPSTQSGEHFFSQFDEHDTHDHIAAVFANRSLAEAAVQELRDVGFGSEHLGVAVRGSGNVVFEHDAEQELLSDFGTGVVVGTPAGLLAGLALATVIVPGLAVGGIVALGLAGAAWGGFLGAYLGIGVGSRTDIEHSEFEWMPLAPDEVLVVVCSHDRPEEISGIMYRHGGSIRVFPKSHD